MAQTMILTLVCDLPHCGAEWSGEGYADAKYCGWVYDFNSSDPFEGLVDLCPEHAP